MPVKLLLDSNKVYHKVFEGSKPGYDALQVDSFLDIVIKDYDTFASYVAVTDQEISNLKAKVDVLTSQLSKAQAEKASLEAKMGEISSHEDTSLNNLELLRKISALEKALSKLGVNPTTIEENL
ncbi:MAG: DivIVA domain-containing protein [Eubacteriales bacterium]|jgi:DivIVA domain-containing protein|nr:DivIVA domain-containing protein [Eubacteriales bacterium]